MFVYHNLDSYQYLQTLEKILTRENLWLEAAQKKKEKKKKKDSKAILYFIAATKLRMERGPKHLINSVEMLHRPRHLSIHSA